MNRVRRLGWRLLSILGQWNDRRRAASAPLAQVRRELLRSGVNPLPPAALSRLLGGIEKAQVLGVDGESGRLICLVRSSSDPVLVLVDLTTGQRDTIELPAGFNADEFDLEHVRRFLSNDKE